MTDREEKINRVVGERRLKDVSVGRFIGGEGLTAMRRLTPTEMKKARIEFAEPDAFYHDFAPLTCTKIEKETYLRVLHQDNLIREIDFENSACATGDITAGTVVRTAAIAYHGGFSLSMVPAAGLTAGYRVTCPMPESKRFGTELMFSFYGADAVNNATIQYYWQTFSARYYKVSTVDLTHTVATDAWTHNGIALNPSLECQQNATVQIWHRLKLIFDFAHSQTELAHCSGTDFKPMPLPATEQAIGAPVDYILFQLTVIAGAGGNGAYFLDDLKFTDEGDSI